MSNLEMLQKLSVGVEDTEKVILDFEGEKAEYTIRPLTSGELSKLQSLEKKPLIVTVGMRNGKRETVNSNINDVDINTGEFTEAQSEAMYQAIAWSLSTNDEVILPEDVKAMKAGLPEILFEKVIEISQLSDEDLTAIKTFRKK